MTLENKKHLDDLLAELGIDLPEGSEMQTKPFFGGAAAYANGRICMTLTKVGFALKLPEVERQELLEAGARPLQYFPNAPIKKQYVVLSEEILTDPQKLRLWIERCIRFATNEGQ